MKWVFGFFICILFAMIYWSSTLIEKDLKTLRKEFTEIKSELNRLQFAQAGVTPHLSEKKTAEVRPHIDQSLPNLLAEDPFYAKTLPNLIGKGFSPKGTRREALLGRPEHLHPFNHFRDISAFWSHCLVTPATNQFGQYEIFSPSAAIKIESRPCKEKNCDCEYWIHLREGIFWEPLRQENFPTDLTLAPHFLKKHPLTAHDFKFYYDAVMNPYVSEPKAASLRTYLGDIEEFRVVDDKTFVVRWKTSLAGSEQRAKYSAFSLTCSLHPLPSFVYQYFSDGQKIIEEVEEDSYRKNSVWAQNFSHHFAKNVIPSCGPWVFWKMDDDGIKFKRNPSHFNPFAALYEELHFAFKQTPESIWQDCKSLKTDLCQLSPSQLPELEKFLKSPLYISQVEKGAKLEEIDFVEQAYYYIGWNQKTPYFQNKNVRLAMTMAIDRDRIISQNLNDMGIPITGPFFRYSPSYDATIEPWPYNPEEAKALLTKEGWVDCDGDGIREKTIDGRSQSFQFSLLYYAKNPATKAICEYVATALREVGVQADIRGLDITDMSHSFEDKTFDAIMFGWALGTPPEDPKQLWYSSGSSEKGSSNAIGFSNPKIDQIIDELQYEYDKEKRISLYHQFHKIIHDEAPYTFLYSPKRQLLYREYVQNLFIPRLRQDLCPGAVVSEPDVNCSYMKTGS